MTDAIPRFMPHCAICLLIGQTMASVGAAAIWGVGGILFAGGIGCMAGAIMISIWCRP